MTPQYDLPVGAQALSRWVGDLSQVAHTRLVQFEDGPERGGRAILARNASGLSATILVDRNMDLGSLDWRGLPLAWQSPSGFRAATLGVSDSEGGRGFERSFGGFLVTCGLDHIRQPAGGQPLHGHYPGTPARLVAHGVDWDGFPQTLFCEGEVVQARLGHEHLRLRRRIEMPIGSSTIKLRDIVRNRAAVAWPQALLYHLNLGFPFLRPGLELRLDGEPLDLAIGPPDPEGEPFVRCLALAGTGRHRVEVIAPEGGPKLTIGFSSGTLPFLQFWHDPRPGTYALAVEPCTSPRADDGTSLVDEGLPPLESGEARRFELTLTLSDA